MTQKNKRFDACVIGLALFAMYFGAGSLIFPPYLGMESGTLWPLGYALFFIMDVGLAFVTMVAMINGDGSISGVTGVVGKVPAIILNTIVIVCLGPLIAIPRTAATTHEMTVLPIFPDVPVWVVSVIFFGLTVALTIRPSKVVDIVGKFLTPLMVIALIVLITAGIAMPLGPVGESAISTSEVVAEGVINGYQAMDVLGALGFSLVISATVTNKGYTEERDRTRITAIACIIAGTMLFLVYCGLTYLGATYSTLEDIANVNQANLLVAITEQLLGRFGVVMLGVIVGLACLTTAIGLASSAAEYFESLSGGRIKYATVVVIIGIFSVIVSNFGLSTIINIATPILSTVFPVVICLILLSFFKKRIHNRNIYKGAALAALLVSLFTVGNSYGLPFAFIDVLPLSSYQLNWILPAVIGGLIGALIRTDHKAEGSAYSMEKGT